MCEANSLLKGQAKKKLYFLTVIHARFILVIDWYICVVDIWKCLIIEIRQYFLNGRYDFAT